MVGLTGVLPAHEVLPQGRTPVRKGGVEGSYLKMANFLSGLRSTAARQNPRPRGRGGFTNAIDMFVACQGELCHIRRNVSQGERIEIDFLTIYIYSIF